MKQGSAKRKYDREYYANYSDDQKRRKYQLQVLRKKNIRSKLNTYKKAHPCSCGETHLACLEFHHIGDGKEINIADAVRHGWSWKRILQEIKKCIVVCANCHRKIHFE